MIFSSRGTDEKQGPTFTMTQVIAKTLATVPNGIALDTVYPADWGMQAEIGADWIVKQFEATVPHCPNTKVVLIGWSQGAMVSSLAATELAKKGYQANVKALYLVGNPYRIPARPGNVDEHGQQGLTYMAKGVATESNPPFVNSVARDGIVLDVCYTGDTICNHAPSKDPAAHGKYGEPKVQAMGANFIIHHLA
ncbi:hypothetical protein V8E36_000574 [Tilletia maclaganii]